MAMVLSLLGLVVGIGSLVCWVMVLIQMFKRGQTGLAIASIVLILCGIGPLIAFIYGWIKSKEWDIMNLMLAWTGCIVVGVILNIMQFAVAANG